MFALASFKAGQGTLQRKKDVATVAKKKEQHTRCAQLRIRRKLARTREPHRLKEREEAKHDGHATQAATKKAATMAGAEAKEFVPTVTAVREKASPLTTPPSSSPTEEEGAEVVQSESNNEEKKEAGKAELTKMPGPQKATSSVVPLPSQDEVVDEKEEEQRKKKKKKKKKKKTPSKTAERREVESGHHRAIFLENSTCRQILADVDRLRASCDDPEPNLLHLQKILRRWCAQHPEALDEPWEEQLKMIEEDQELEFRPPRRSKRLQTAPPGV
jgi:hypothetical protein